MLFSGGGGSSAKPKKEEKKERKAERDEKYEIQEAVFMRWANWLLEEHQQFFVIQELKDLADLKFLSTFSYIITGQQITLTGNRFDDVDLIFHSLVNDEEDKLLQLCIPEICDGVQKRVLEMMWLFIQIYWRRFAPAGARERMVAEALKTWCLEATSSHKEVIVNDFKSSWRDGIALNILLMSENLVNLNQIRELRGDERIENALNIAKREFKVPKLIHPKDFHSEHLDMKSVVCYLMTLYLAMVSSSAASGRSRAKKQSAQQMASNKGQRFSTSSNSSISAVANAAAAAVAAAAAATSGPIPGHVYPQSIHQHSPPTTGSPTSSMVAGRQFTPPKVHSPKTKATSFSYTQSPLVGPNPVAFQQPSTSSQLTHSGTPPFMPLAQMTGISPLAHQRGSLPITSPAIASVQVYHQTQHSDPQAAYEISRHKNSDHVPPGVSFEPLPQHMSANQTAYAPKEMTESVNLSPKRKSQSNTPAMSNTNSTVSSAITVIDTRELLDEPLSPTTTEPNTLVGPNEPIQDIRSRKSSSSSQKSSSGKKSMSRGRKSTEDIIKEYEQCLEQVLTWLLEAEQEMEAMGVFKAMAETPSDPAKRRESMNEDLETVKRRFREHEQFMRSLTESQDSVGRVLLRGQQLSHKLDGETAAGIQNQLVMVNERWENIRTLAMEQQELLQMRLNILQKDHLNVVIEWLTEFEKIISDIGHVVSDDSEVCRRQIAAHTQIQEQIDAQQQSIQRLSSFVAIVDSLKEDGNTDDDQNVTELESMLQNVGERWVAICEWAETRTKLLDGVAELLDDCHGTFDYLNRWLNKRQNELENLRSAHHLNTEEEVVEQMRLLKKMESALETEHSAFVRLSQLCSELVQRFENGKNKKAANKLRNQLDQITQIWDNIVTRLEEHSQMLVRTGKTKLCEPSTSSTTKHRRTSEKQGSLTSSDSSSATAKKQHLEDSKKIEESTNEEEQKIVNSFVEKVAAMECEIRGLVEWTNEFSMSPRREDARQMVKICHKKLSEIKKVEPNVTRLQIELEKIHALPVISTRQLHIVNETFDHFMQRWSLVVSKISDSLNVLTNSPSGSDEGEIEMIMSRINGWISQTNQIMDALIEKVENNPESIKRVTQIAKQLTEQQRHVTYLKRAQRKAGEPSTLQKLDKLEENLIKILDKIEDFRNLGRPPSTTSVMQLKKQPVAIDESITVDESANKRRDQPEKPQRQTSISIPKSKDHLETSPEPAPHEADSLRKRLEFEANAEAEEQRRQKQQAQTELCNWIQQTEDALKKGECTPGDLNDLQTELEQCNSLISEIKTKQIGPEIIQEGDEAVRLIKNSISKLQKSAEQKRNNIQDSINKTQLALHKFVKAEEVADKNSAKLDKLKSGAEVDLSKVEMELKALHEQIFTDEAMKLEALNFLEDIISIVSNSNSKQRDLIIASMRQRTNKLENLWRLLIDKLDNQIVELQKERRDRAEKTLRTLSEYLQELDKGVKASAEATDAEELSEHLDNLDRFLERLKSGESESTEDGSWLLLNELANDASPNQDPQIAQQMVQLQRAYENILPLAQDRCVRLRDAVSKCDYFEQALCHCQSWCTHMNHILGLRISTDIQALEIPSEYKKAFESGTLIPQMDKEFEEYDKLINELDDFIERSKSQWSSSDRLRLQSEHAKTQLGELKVKYNEFKQPILLKEGMDKLSHELAEIELAIDDLTGAENCEYCLIHSRQIYKQLEEELGIECRSLESFKDDMVRDAILNEAQTMEITPKIIELQEKQAHLEQRALNTVEKLQRCLELLEKLDKENLEVNNLLTKMEENLVNAIAETPQKDGAAGNNSNEKPAPQTGTTHRRTRLSKLKQELRHALEAVEKARELETLLRQNSIRLAPNTLELIGVRDQRVAQLKSQLSIWAESMNMEDENSVLETFEQLGLELRENLNLLDLPSSMDNVDEEEGQLRKSLDKLRPLKIAFESAGMELLHGPVEPTIRNEVNTKLAQLGALWHRFEQPRKGLIESPVKSDVINPDDDGPPLYVLNPDKQSPILDIESSNIQTQSVQPIKPLITSNTLPESHEGRRPLPHLDSLSLSESFNTQNFAESVAEMLAEFQNAYCYLDFEQFPIESLEEWEARIKHLNDWVSENKPKLDDLLAIGKRVAESGRVELVNHDALGHLDELIDVVHKIDTECENQEEQLKNAIEKHRTLMTGLEHCRMQINRLGPLDALEKKLNPAKSNAATNILAIQQGVMEARSQLQVLQLATDEIHKSLPGYTKSSAINQKLDQNNSILFPAFSTESSVLDELNAQLREIESKVQEALVKALQAQEAKSITQLETTQYFDAISVSSGGGGAGLSLTMDVQETEPEESADDGGGHSLIPQTSNQLLQTSVLVRPSRIQFQGPSGQSTHNLEQFYVNLDAMEDYMEQTGKQSERLPFEGLEEKMEILQDFDVELQRGENLIQEQQMTMGVAESENVLERIGLARDQVGKRRKELIQRREQLNGLHNLFEQTEHLLTALGNKCEVTRRGSRKLASPENGRNKSPDLDELESTQLDLEDQLPPLAVHLQQCQNRLEACQNQLSAAVRDGFLQRRNQMNTDFQKYGKQIRERRKNLEERLADQTHLNNQLEMLEFWCDETEANISGSVTFLNPEHLASVLEQVEIVLRNEMPDKLHGMNILEHLKDRFVALPNVEPDAKHEIRRSVALLAKRVSDLKLQVNERLQHLIHEKEISDQFWAQMQDMDSFIQDAYNQIESVEQAKIYKPLMVNIERLSNEVVDRRPVLQQIQNQLTKELEKFPKKHPAKVEAKNQQRVQKVVNEFDAIDQQIQHVLKEHAQTSSDSDNENEIKQIYTQMDSTRKHLKQEIEDVQAAGVAIVQQQHQNTTDEAIFEEKSDDQSTEYGTLSSRGSRDETDSRKLENGILYLEDPLRKRVRPPPKMNVEEQARLDTVTRFRSWLQETERDVAITVDIADQNIVRQAISKIQNWIDELEINQSEIARILLEGHDRLVLERAQLCSHEMEKVLALCQKRKTDLQRIIEQSRIWEEQRLGIENWLNEANEKILNGGRVNELTDQGIVEQIEIGEQLASKLDHWKSKMKQFNDKSNELLDVYRRDDGHNLSHYTSRLNTQWSKFNDALRIRRAILEAAQRSRQDFHTVLGQFQQWLNQTSKQIVDLEKETNNIQRLKDTSQRKEWMAQDKEIEVEIDAHRSIFESVHQMGKRFMDDQQDGPGASGRQREQLRDRLKCVDDEWRQILETKRIIKERLENAQEECERLTLSLADFLYWTHQQLKLIDEAQPVGGDLTAVQKQNDMIKSIERAMVSKDRHVKDCIYLAHSYLMQHDLRPAMHTPSVLEPHDQKMDFSTISEAEREERRIGVQILADSEKLKTSWELLRQQVETWSKVVTSAHSDMEELDRTIAESLLAIGTIEDEIQRLPPVESLRLEQLKEARSENADIRRRVHEASTRIDDVNDWSGQIAAKNIAISEQLSLQIQAINQRYEKLKKDVGCRGAALERAFNDFGPSSEHFLIDSVQPPWQRAISASNKLPYYIDHKTENTQWDHPAMVDILERLCTFNQVKFSAYRTAMKLRALQKRLCLDLIELSELDESFEQRLKEYKNDERLRLEDAVMCLVPLFELANERFPHLLTNAPMALDLAINLLLNIYDPCRDGKLRVLSFKVALVVLCNATLESKYKYLFHLISTSDGVDHKSLGVLFYDLIHIPKFFGESAAFGGSNIEPSVRSCFEHSKFPPNIFVEDFLNWLKLEPQSLVWLPVMHRLASSEFAKHQAKCNACKMFPIVGMRYRCLRCFNFDICQNCFFSQRTAKNHKLTHPMQEYCLPVRFTNIQFHL